MKVDKNASYMLLGIALMTGAYFFGKFIQKKQLIGDGDKDTLLFRHELTGVPNEAGGGDGFRGVSEDAKKDFYVCKCNLKKS